MNKDIKIIGNKDIKLSDFSPRLRRIAEIMINSIEFYSLKKACELANVNYDSARTMISRYRKKGIDFNDFVGSKAIELLNKGKYDVYRSIRDRAIDGTAQDRRLFTQLTGDLVERQQVDHRHAVIVSSPLSNTVPQDILDKRAEQDKKDKETIVDVEVSDHLHMDHKTSLNMNIPNFYFSFFFLLFFILFFLFCLILF